MNRAQLETALRTAAIIPPSAPVIVIGSQSILGTWSEANLPRRATMSAEVDILTSVNDQGEFAANITLFAGTGTDFADKHGFYIDGVDGDTATLPNGWELRLVKVRAGDSLGWCLDPHDLCIAKLFANREQDHDFVRALVDAGLIRPALLFDRLADTTMPTANRTIVGNFIGWLATQAPTDEEIAEFRAEYPLQPQVWPEWPPGSPDSPTL